MFANNRGFTLIELVMVIVILGLLAAVAVPKYQDLRSEAAIAAANGVYGGASAATAVNFAARLFSPSKSAITTSAVTLVAAMEELPTGWTVSGASLESLDGTYVIKVTAGELPAYPAVPTSKATLSKNW